MTPLTAFNPFPGLRPFEPNEDHLFFGRERQVDELVHRLRSTRLLSVVGGSGMGKSSLVRCGLIPSLQGGLMPYAGCSWRVAVMRPAEDPIAELAAALDRPEVLGVEGELQTTNRVLLEATLRRGTGGLVEAVRLAHIPSGDNLLLVIDQFEELFRFRRSGANPNSHDEAALFVKLILEASQQPDLPLYSALTMRSDFIGDCMEFAGLPEAVSAGQYLVPRLSRDELRSAITGPVAVAGGEIAPRLVTRLLNDVGDDPDQLPLLQHALMRTCEHARFHGPMDIEDYEAIGAIGNALSWHAEEAFTEAAAATSPELVATVFRALTDTTSDARGIRRPTSVRDLTAICEAPESSVKQVVEIFRAPGRSFLMPPASVLLTTASIIDISHESLMRCWTRLIAWSEEERASAEIYERITQASGWFFEGAGGLWRDPELAVGLRWHAQNRPTPAWAKRYNPNFPRAIAFLENSAQERDRVLAEQEQARSRKLQQAWSIAGALGTLSIACAVFAWFAVTERNRAEHNLNMATKAVDEMLSSAGSESGRVAAEIPEVQSFRKELLSKAEAFYSDFLKQQPTSDAMQREMAMAHVRLGDAHRLAQEDPEEALHAMDEYTQAIQMFTGLTRSHPGDRADLELLANAYNWLGETARIAGKPAAAEDAYNQALAIQQELNTGEPQSPTYPKELARTYSNRGILRYLRRDPVGSERDYMAAIDLLKPLSGSSATYLQEVDRAYNNRANLLNTVGRSSEAEQLYQQAIASHTQLVKSFPGNRDYQWELAEFAEDLAILYSETSKSDLAEQWWRTSNDYIQQLARRAPSVDLRLATSQVVHGEIAEAEGRPGKAAEDYTQSLHLLRAINAGNLGAATVEYHRTYGETLEKLAALRQTKDGSAAALPLLEDAIQQYEAAGANFAPAATYVNLTVAQLNAGMVSDATKSLEKLSSLLPQMTGPEKAELTKKAKLIAERISSSKTGGH